MGAYKFAVPHIAHVSELCFKYQVSKRHRMLQYKNPFAREVEKGNTINLWDGQRRLTACFHLFIDKAAMARRGCRRVRAGANEPS